jgi:hypothetical protein
MQFKLFIEQASCYIISALTNVSVVTYRPDAEYIKGKNTLDIFVL